MQVVGIGLDRRGDVEIDAFVILDESTMMAKQVPVLFLLDKLAEDIVAEGAIPYRIAKFYRLIDAPRA